MIAINVSHQYIGMFDWTHGVTPLIMSALEGVEHTPLWSMHRSPVEHEYW